MAERQGLQLSTESINRDAREKNYTDAMGTVALVLRWSAVGAKGSSACAEELRLEVHDPHGIGRVASGELVSESPWFRRTFVAGPEGRYSCARSSVWSLPLSLQAEGFAAVERFGRNTLRGAGARGPWTLGVAPVTKQVQVNDSATLVDPYSTGSLYSIGRQAIEEHDAAQPGARTVGPVSEQRVGCNEANGVLHPRGRNTTCNSCGRTCH